jgi:hypothetical protein
MRHPAELGAADVTRFLTALADAGRVRASTQTQALSALLFLYRQMLGCDLESLGSIVRAGQPVRVPVALTREEVRLFYSRPSAAPPPWDTNHGRALAALDICLTHGCHCSTASKTEEVPGESGMRLLAATSTEVRTARRLR